MINMHQNIWGLTADTVMIYRDGYSRYRPKVRNKQTRQKPKEMRFFRGLFAKWSFSVYQASNYTSRWNELERVCEEAVVAWSSYCPRICQEILKTTTRNLSDYPKRATPESEHSPAWQPVHHPALLDQVTTADTLTL